MFRKTQSKKTDKFSGEYSGLDKEIIAQVPDIKNDARLVEIDEAVRGFQVQLKEVDALIQNFRNYPNEGPRPEPISAEADAKKLLDGADRESLSGPDDVDKRRNLLRQKAAIEMAITILESERLELISELCRAAVVELTPLAQDFAKDLLDSYAELEKQLEMSGQFYQLLQRKGIEKGRTPAFWTMTNVDLSILNGANGLPGLGWYINSRKEFWGLK